MEWLEYGLRVLPVELSGFYISQAVWVGAGQQQDVSLKRINRYASTCGQRKPCTGSFMSGPPDVHVLSFYGQMIECRSFT